MIIWETNMFANRCRGSLPSLKLTYLFVIVTKLKKIRLLLCWCQEVLNKCFDDIEQFMTRLQGVADAYKELEQRRKSRKKKAPQHGGKKCFWFFSSFADYFDCRESNGDGVRACHVAIIRTFPVSTVPTPLVIVEPVPMPLVVVEPVPDRTGPLRRLSKEKQWNLSLWWLQTMPHTVNSGPLTKFFMAIYSTRSTHCRRGCCWLADVIWNLYAYDTSNYN